MNKTYTDEDLALVCGRVLAACDKLDGIEDGMVANFRACTNTVVKTETRRAHLQRREGAQAVPRPADHRD